MIKTNRKRKILFLLILICLILWYFNNKILTHKIIKESELCQCYTSKTKKQKITYGFYDILTCLDEKKGYRIKSISTMDTNNICYVEAEFTDKLFNVIDRIQSISKTRNFISLESVEISKIAENRFKIKFYIKFLKDK